MYVWACALEARQPLHTGCMHVMLRQVTLMGVHAVAAAEVLLLVIANGGMVLSAEILGTSKESV